MEKGHIDHTHGPSTENRWIFILFKKKSQLGLIYDMQSTQRSTTPLFSALLLAKEIERTRKK